MSLSAHVIDAFHCHLLDATAHDDHRCECVHGDVGRVIDSDRLKERFLNLYIELQRPNCSMSKACAITQELTPTWLLVTGEVVTANSKIIDTPLPHIPIASAHIFSANLGNTQVSRKQFFFSVCKWLAFARLHYAWGKTHSPQNDILSLSKENRFGFSLADGAWLTTSYYWTGRSMLFSANSERLSVGVECVQSPIACRVP